MEETLKQIIDVIISLDAAEKIFLLGSMNAEKKAENIFLNEPVTWQEPGYYDLLVLVKDESRTNSIQDTIETRCRNIIPVTALTISLSAFNSLIKTGHPFATHIIEADCLVHDTKTTLLAEPGSFDQEVWNKTTYKECFQWFENAMSFQAGCELFLLRKEYRAAAFLLHQTAEQFLRSIIQAATGFRVQTHNLEKLLRYTRWFSKDLPQLYPRSTDRDKHLFRLLQSAYSEGRYSTSYTVKFADLKTLYLQTQKLQNIAMYYAGITAREN